MTAADRGRAAAFRRYPALAYLAGAVVLALLLPSGLTLPNSGPATLAEYAPVPGQGEGTSDVAEVAQATSGAGPGFGRAGAAGTATTLPDAHEAPDDAARAVRRPGNKRCVGDPPRQTEDPLSPPCVAFFDGDNGGATARGVSRDEIVAVLQAGNAPTGTNGRETDCSGEPTADEALVPRLCKALSRFFNERYQTYGRRVHLVSWESNQWTPVVEKHKPFSYSGGNASPAGRGVLTTGYDGKTARTYDQWPKHVVSFRPSYESQAAIFGSYVCTKLARRPARFAGDATYRTTSRKFVMWALSESARPRSVRNSDAVAAACGVTMEVVAGAGDPTLPARLRRDGHTTVITCCSGGSSLQQQAALATQQGWFPEWVVVGADANGADTNASGRTMPAAQWQNALAVSFDYRRDAIEDQPWYRAYREGCPECRRPTAAEATSVNPAAVYDELAMLFYGIQAAGPKLTVDNFDRGMHAIPARGSDDPYRPAAYFEAGRYDYLKDAMAMWWDPTGQAPSSSQPGCWRLSLGGRRHRVAEWTAGDDDVRSETDPCQGDAV